MRRKRRREWRKRREIKNAISNATNLKYTMIWIVLEGKKIKWDGFRKKYN